MENQGIWSASYDGDIRLLDEKICVDENFDITGRKLRIGNKRAKMYYISGLCDCELLQKNLEFLLRLPAEKMPQDITEFLEMRLPYMDADGLDALDEVIQYLLSGDFLLLIEGYQKAVRINARSYPGRSVQEPEKDKVLRGSKDGFVEALIPNTVLIRRRIRDANLRMEMVRVGKASRTDVAICYMADRVDRKLLEKVRGKIENIRIDSLTMNMESLAECLVPGHWYNPFPKFKYSERPDTTCAHLLEGNVVVMVDNAPSAMILPTSFFDVMDEADDYYFPPLTGSYLRLTRSLIALLTYLMTPTFLLLINHPEYVPKAFSFILLEEQTNIPVFWQFLILELAIDGLRLAAVSTPNMLNTPLSIMAGLVLGEFSVKSGWFCSEVMLYMAFVAVANYTQTNYELGYALKFMRMISLVLTELFGVYGYFGGMLFMLFCMLSNRTLSHRGYLYPLLPFNGKELLYRLIRRRLPGSRRQAEKN